MRTLSQSFCRFAMLLLVGGAGAAAAAGPGGLSSPYFSRWTIAEKNPVFTQRGRAYKTIDIAQCGRDFCGVSVDEKGVCGPTLFRFLAKRAGGEEILQGHGKWGADTKNVQIYWSEALDYGDHSRLEIYLGDGRDFGGRSDNMPKFHAEYRRAGAVKCRAR